MDAVMTYAAGTRIGGAAVLACLLAVTGRGPSVHAGVIRIAPGAKLIIRSGRNPPIIIRGGAHGVILPGPLMVGPAAGAPNTTAPHFSRFQVNDSFGARDQLRTAAHLLHNGHPFQALRLYQQVVERRGRKVIAIGPNAYQSIRGYVWNLLLKTPAVESGDYDQLYGRQALQALTAAERTHHLRALLAACERYLPSSAAAKGLRRAAEAEFDRGRFALAARLWLQLWPEPAAKAWRPQLLDHAALSAWLAGEKKLARRLQLKLQRRYPQARGWIAGRRRRLVPQLQASLAADAWTGRRSPTTGAFRWTSWQGNGSGDTAADTRRTPDAMLWARPLRALPVLTAPSGQRNIQNLRLQARSHLAIFGLNVNLASGAVSGQLMFEFPICDAGILYLNAIDRIEAWDLNSGYSRWRYPRHRRRAGDRQANLAALSMGLDQFSCSLSRNRLVAIIRIRSAAPRPIWTMYGYNGISSTALVALNARTGRLLWRQRLRRLLRRAAGDLVWPACPPLAGRRGIFLPVVAARPGSGQVQLFLLRFNARNGRVQWRRYLGTLSEPVYSLSTVDMAAGMKDSLIYLVTGQGAILAVGANSGTIRWLRLTAAAHRPFPGMLWSQAQRQRPWKINPPLIDGDRLIVLDTLGAGRYRVDVFNRWSGRPLASWSRRRWADADLLLGATGGRLYVAGRRVAAINLHTGRTQWVSAPLSSNGALAARPFLTKHYIYLPLQGGLLRLVTATGAAEKLQPWPSADGRPGAPGNLLVTPHLVVLANDRTVEACAGWPDVLAYWRARIRADAGQPQPYLTLAAVAFRTGHRNLAQRMMRHAVQRAAAGAGPSTVGGRIFDMCLHLGRQLERRGGSSGAADGASFYFEQARRVAATPLQQIRWRLAMARLARHRRQPRRALKLLQEILASNALRSAPIRSSGNILPAAAVVENLIAQRLLDRYGRGIYRRYERAAGALLRRAGTGSDPADLQRVLAAYPNSSAATTAAWRLAGLWLAAHRWRRVWPVLLWLQSRVKTPADRALLLADLARTMLGLKRWNQALALAQRGQMRYRREKLPGAPHFAALARSIERAAPPNALARWPALACAPSRRLVVSRPFRGTLLSAVDPNPHFQRYTCILMTQPANRGLRLLDRNAFGALQWSVLIPGVNRLALLGYEGPLALLAAPDRIFALSLRTGKTRWTITPRAVLGSAAPAAKPAPLPAAPGFPGALAGAPPMFNGGVLIGPGQPMFFQPPGFAFAGGPAWDTQAQQEQLATKLVWRLRTALGSSVFQLVQLFAGRFLIVAENRAMLYRAATGQACWPRAAILPSGGPVTAVAACGDFLALAQRTPITTVAWLDAHTGRRSGLTHFPGQDGLLWMKAGPAGTLYLSGLAAALAYDPGGTAARPLWVRRLEDPFPTASQLTLYGLLVPRRHGLTCLDPATGQTRWRRCGGAQGFLVNGGERLATFLNRDSVVVMTSRTLQAYGIRRGAVRWRAAFLASPTPVLVALKMGDPDLAVLATGGWNQGPVAMRLYLVDQADRHGRLDNGALVFVKRLVRSRDNATAPSVARWALVHHGLVFQVGQHVFLYNQRR